jgi:hypothetical protein
MGWVVSVTPRPRFTPGERTSGTHCTGGWVGPTEATGKILFPCRGSNPDCPVVQPIVRHYTARAIPALTLSDTHFKSNQNMRVFIISENPSWTGYFLIFGCKILSLHPTQYSVNCFQCPIRLTNPLPLNKKPCMCCWKLYIHELVLLCTHCSMNW